ncbi:MAG: recombination regulator RecX [Aquabacterium sp.]
MRARALRWLAQREHSTAELRGKLARLGAPLPAVDALLAALQEQGHLSDARFVASRTRVRAARYGTARIAAELRQRGAPADTDTLDSLRASELQRAAEVFRRRFGEPAATPALRAKQARFLLQRGFATAVVRRVVAGLDDEATAGQADAAEDGDNP